MRPREFLASLDKELLLLVLAISAIGVINLYSASQATRPGVHLLQLGYIAVGLCLALMVAAIDLRVLARAAYPIYVVGCLLLVAVLVAGTAIKGSQRWINLGFFNLQPSELMKVAIIFAMARYLSRYNNSAPLSLSDLLRPLNPSRPLALGFLLITQYQQLILADSPTWTTVIRIAAFTGIALWLLLSVAHTYRVGFPACSLVAPVDLMAVPAVLILVEPDLGTTLITLAIAGAITLFVGIRWRSLVVLMVIGFAAVIAAWLKVLKPYQKQRVKTFLDPEADALGAGYHANQSMIAIGSGGVQGKGFTEGTQTQLSFLPENHTDFVFSVLAEEWGLFGATILIALFAALLLKGVRIAASAKDRFSVLCAVGATALVFWQVLVNIGMVTGLMPVVGVTLPLMSYGGSSILTVMFAVGIWLSTSRRRNVY